MNWIEAKNLQPLSLPDIPKLPASTFCMNIIDKMQAGMRMVQFFADRNSHAVLYAVLADDAVSRLYVASTEFAEEQAYPSMTPEIPALHLFEREVFEQYGIKPQGHPWLKPVRLGIAGIDNKQVPYQFFEMVGDQVHEVGVGPIHAGVIEPGHFRFSCHGEDVFHLEIELGFQHRGVEELFIRHRANPGYLLKLAESIAGDTVIGHGIAFVSAMESLAGISISNRAMAIRTIALELERIAVHLGDLAALSGDVAYLTGNAVFGALRTSAINASMAICGSRFGRGLLAIGGVQFDISDDLAGRLQEIVDSLQEKTDLAAGVLFSSASVLARFDKTGFISQQTAHSLGMVGPAARASGMAVDIRADHPFGAYSKFPVYPLTLNSGDVFARAYIRYIEITQSCRIIREQLENPGDGELAVAARPLQPGQLVISLCEGWRGEIAHAAIIDNDGNLRRYKIKDPSFNNWMALAMAVRNEGISDFPLCNKSFNLSYCGFDL